MRKAARTRASAPRQWKWQTSDSRLQNYLHQIGFLMVEPLEPLWALFERRPGADDRLDLNGALGQQIETNRIFARGCARTQQFDLPADNRLQGDFDLRREIAHQRHRAPLAH